MRITRTSLLFITTGLDPVVHFAVQRSRQAGLNMRPVRMDCRVKPGNDEVRERSRDTPCPGFAGVRLVD
jgi:hypothetical protein